MSALSIFRDAETAYSRGKPDDTFEKYQKAIKKLIRDENLFQKVPGVGPQLPDFPQELLGVIWRNFNGFFRDEKLPQFTKETAPDGYKFLTTFRPKSTRNTSRFRGEKLQLLLKGMQISTALTMGLLAWDAGDRPSAAKYYEEGLEIIEALPQRVKRLDTAQPNLEKWIATDSEQLKFNLDALKHTDNIQSMGQPTLRKDVANIPHTRFEADGSVSIGVGTQISTDACAKCGVRGVKFSRCGACKKIAYCGTECQRADWKNHKPFCKANTVKNTT
ncbi:SET domain-containing protein 14 [Leucoagaricus sp. SymC.cos]|nr:SET domain-containing protein 14 [Leucoagaricus sp. SymC.cos]